MPTDSAPSTMARLVKSMPRAPTPTRIAIDHAGIVQAGVDRLAQRQRRVDGRQHAVAHDAAHQARQQHADDEGHDRHADVAERDGDAADLHAAQQLAEAVAGWRRCRRSRRRGWRSPAAATRTQVEQQQHEMLAAQRRVGRQAEALAHPAAGRRVGRGGGLEQVADEAMQQQRDRDQQAGRRRWRSEGGRRASHSPASAKTIDDSTATLSTRRAIDHQVPPIIGGSSRALGPRRMPGRLARAGRASSATTVASTRAPTAATALASRRRWRQRDVDEVDGERRRPSGGAAHATGSRALASVKGRMRQAGRCGDERRGGEAEHQQQGDQAQDRVRAPARRWATAARSPAAACRSARRRGSAPAPARGRRWRRRWCGRAGSSSWRVAAAEAAAQAAAGPPQGDGEQRPRPPAARDPVRPTRSAASPSRLQVDIAADRACSRGDELRPDLAPDLARQRRGVAAQQGLQHDLAAQLGQALEQLVGAGDHDLALLDPAFADRRLLGQPLAFGLHGIRFGRRHRCPA